MSEEKEKIEMFDDDSKAFKLLYHELKDVKDVIIHDIKDVVVKDFKDTDDYLLDVYKKASGKVKTYLHYTSDDLKEDKEAKRRAIEKVERVGFKNKVVLPNEGMDNITVDARYNQLPGNAEECPICKSKKDKPYISMSGKPESIAIDDSDEEVNKTIKKNEYRKSLSL